MKLVDGVWSKMKLSLNQVLTSFSVVITSEIDHDPEKESNQRELNFRFHNLIKVITKSCA